MTNKHIDQPSASKLYDTWKETWDPLLVKEFKNALVPLLMP